MTEAAERTEPLERERDLDRLLTFVDAIVAIAITLLVLPLAELAANASEKGRVTHLLSSNADDIWSFVLSFYVISALWRSQHASVGSLIRDSPRIITMLMLWSFTIVVVPFPTALVAHAGEQGATKVLYIGTMVLSNVVIAALRVEIGRHPELTDGSPTPSAVRVLVTPVLMLLALAAMLAFPGASYWPMLLLLVDGRLVHLVERARNRRAT